MFYLHGELAQSTTGHGGNQRSAQISELVQQASVSTSTLRPKKANLKDRLLEVVRSMRLSKHLPPSRRALSDYRELLTRVAQFSRNPEIQALITERAYWDPLAVCAAWPLPLIAVPQNVESLVCGQRRALGRNLAEDFAAEARYLSKASRCYLICEEDAAIASAICQNVSVLPYFPPAAHLNFLSKVRERRRCNQKSDGHVLVLGSVINPPTRHGMTELLRHLSGSNYSAKLSIVVAGYGTESLDIVVNDDRVRFLGSVDTATLEGLLTKAKCLWVHHSPTTGSLTRVVDSLVAGVPVISNMYGMRGHVSQKGVMEYRDLADALGILKEIRFEQPAMPARPHRESEKFMQDLKTLHASFRTEDKNH